MCSIRKIFIVGLMYIFGPLCISSGHVEAAITSYKQALLLRPDFPEATCNLLHTLQVRLLAPVSFLWLLFISHRLSLVYSYSLLLCQCVCCWEDRSKMFTEVEGIIRRQINVSV